MDGILITTIIIILVLLARIFAPRVRNKGPKEVVATSSKRTTNPRKPVCTWRNPRQTLEFMNMVIKEGLRLHPPAPLLLPHTAAEDTEVNGSRIPGNVSVVINAWSIGSDPSAWRDPEKFSPERFQGSQINVRGQHFQLPPFGAGRRWCPGALLALNVVRSVVAQLAHCFDWGLPDGMLVSELDMTEEFGMVTSRAKDLRAVSSYRLRESTNNEQWDVM